MKKIWPLILIGLLVLAGSGLRAQSYNDNITPGIMRPELVSYLNDPRRPRGIRNNNPGNIRRSSSAWQGRVSWAESKDKSFEQFEYFFWGVRALVIVLRSYFTKYNLNTIEQIITRWAPPSENNTASYISSVVTLTGFKKNQVLIPDKETLRRLTYAICDHENGVKDQITDEVFNYAYSKL